MKTRLSALFLLTACLAACAGPNATGFPVPLGSQAECAGLTCRVLSSGWGHQLTVEGGKRVVPNRDFLLVRVELTNSGPASRPAGWLPRLWLVDEHHDLYAPSPVTARFEGGLRGQAAEWPPGGKLRGVLVYDVAQALYWLQPEGCPALELGSWWPERFGD
jgi:hypothetical protein